MDPFTGGIAAMLEVALIGVGLIVLHFGIKDHSKLLKAAAYTMMIDGVVGLLCTSYFWFTYYQAGTFDVSVRQL